MPNTSPHQDITQPKRRSLRVPRRARLGDPPLLRRVGDELAYTPTRCRVTASLSIRRLSEWWQHLAPAELTDACMHMPTHESPK
ncbi:hypothetical protein HUS70_04930 [Pandoraea nosoerga]|uniref:Uncharacterized protein n=1 Tax=Pandoraea nosoerga TaxID=2508296 RepID=A0A5E4SHB7_9BURK|nr:hypothetical protein [Pandoraea nosoerga]MBN4665324.1 hypothetical protein [Pandoraea nosoerga]MBN4674724.1 hypothetical protein [Pandoraea nosoerga]MBN4680613.1 hypothetical protein [Pandoraea nosoerga]MBN4744018.1 hypothetical protein [Pandoraea nosoerga]VVD74571.1 hypothetical protein PNO31109_00761 [Pandoraea nosoerga]